MLIFTLNEKMTKYKENITENNEFFIFWAPRSKQMGIPPGYIFMSLRYLYEKFHTFIN